MIEAPAYSAGEMNDKLAIRVDSGKFMDTQFLYDKFDVVKDSSGKDTLLFSTSIVVCIVNGVVRDKLELEHKEPELQAEFLSTVAQPILHDLITTVNEQPQEDTQPKIIL